VLDQRCVRDFEYRSDRHRSVEGFCHYILRVFDVRLSRELLVAAWKFFCAERIWIALELLLLLVLMNIRQEDTLKRL